ncbi:MAG: hypothetical protein GY859_32885, partial [Desulfobacterales bacterium]|nr:hypothetical protein [Desulfobacterales bacterium]
MNKNRENDIYAVPVFDNYLIHSPSRRVAALVNGAALVKARDMLRENRDGDKAAGNSRGLFSRLTA